MVIPLCGLLLAQTDEELVDAGPIAVRHLARLDRLPRELLDKLIGALEGDNELHLEIAALVLIGRKDCHAEVIKMNRDCFRSLFKLWRKFAMFRSLAIRVVDHQLCIWTSEGSTRTPFENEHQEKMFAEEMESAFRAMASPRARDSFR